jgi:hypothetical protein
MLNTTAIPVHLASQTLELAEVRLGTVAWHCGVWCRVDGLIALLLHRVAREQLLGVWRSTRSNDVSRCLG